MGTPSIQRRHEMFVAETPPSEGTDPNLKRLWSRAAGNGWTWREWARRCGLSPYTLINVMADTSRPSWKTLRRMCDGTGAKLVVVFEEPDENLGRRSLETGQPGTGPQPT